MIGVNTPYVPFPTTDLLRAAFPDDEKLYMLWFQQPGVAEKVLDAEPRLVFEKLMRRGVEPAPGGLAERDDANPFRRLREMEPYGEELLSPEEIDVYARAFEKSGFFGPVSWYRNIDRNKGIAPGIGVRKLDLPCLQITAEWDAAIRPEMAAGMPAVCSDLEIHMISRCGHWTQQEKPEELNRLMLDWLGRRFSRS
jgi:pimeloyl-ACP methyl ester carboxylesterase